MVTPLVFNLEKQTARSGWELNEKISNALISATVLTKSKLCEPGDIIYVRASEVSATSYVKNIYEFKGQKCILLPESYLVLVDRK